MTAPTSISATQNTYSDKIEINWAKVADASVYALYNNSTNDASTAVLISDSINTNFYTDYVAANTTNFYWVTSGNGEIWSKFSLSARGSSAIPEPACFFIILGMAAVIRKKL